MRLLKKWVNEPIQIDSSIKTTVARKIHEARRILYAFNPGFPKDTLLINALYNSSSVDEYNSDTSSFSAEGSCKCILKDHKITISIYPGSPGTNDGIGAMIYLQDDKESAFFYSYADTEIKLDTWHVPDELIGRGFYSLDGDTYTTQLKVGASYQKLVLDKKPQYKKGSIINGELLLTTLQYFRPEDDLLWEEHKIIAAFFRCKVGRK
ncbi:MAG TPA: hypothetical protein VE978_05540 [Chitinophagales bacterium]|nr:hypothetical protein [Chitinophagales bacterium]